MRAADGRGTRRKPGFRRWTRSNFRCYGPHQRMNAAAALAAVRALAGQIPVSEDAIRAGLSRVHWPGRLQWVRTASGRTVVLDGAHNPAGAEVLRVALEDGVSGRKALGDLWRFPRQGLARACAHSLAPLAGRLVLTPVHSERTEDPAELAPPAARRIRTRRLKFAPRSRKRCGKRPTTPLWSSPARFTWSAKRWNCSISRPHRRTTRSGLNEWSAGTADDPCLPANHERATPGPGRDLRCRRHSNRSVAVGGARVCRSCGGTRTEKSLR